MALCMGLVAASSSNAQVAVTSSTLVERTAAPGETYRGTITIHNSSDRVQVVSFSLADYGFYADGSTTFELAIAVPNAAMTALMVVELVLAGPQ